MGKIITGFIILCLGFLLLWKSYSVVKIFGENPWVEYKFGSSGGTNLMYKLIGILIMFFGILTISGLRDGFLLSTIGKIFSMGK